MHKQTMPLIKKMSKQPNVSTLNKTSKRNLFVDSSTSNQKKIIDTFQNVRLKQQTQALSELSDDNNDLNMVGGIGEFVSEYSDNPSLTDSVILETAIREYARDDEDIVRPIRSFGHFGGTHKYTLNQINDDYDNYDTMIGGFNDKNTTQTERPMRNTGRQKQKTEFADVELDICKYPICREILMDDSDLIDCTNKKVSSVLHTDTSYAQFALGFNHWLHASKNKTDVFKTFIGKKHVYHVLNGYEHNIDDYSESIANESSKFFEVSKLVIQSRTFHKIWEILMYFDLIDPLSKKFVSTHLSPAPSSVLQAVMGFREKFCKDSKNDRYFYIPSKDLNDEYRKSDAEFVKYISKDKRVTSINRVNSLKQSVAETIKNVDTKVDLVTGGYWNEWNTENIQEQICASYLLEQIVSALNIQKKGGDFILKMYETYTKISLKLILLLKSLYENVYIIKPLTSRESNSDRYVVCRKFKHDSSEIQPMIDGLISVLEKLDEIPKEKKSSMFLDDLFLDIKIPNSLSINMICINTEIANHQFKVINKMITYIEGSNYYGELYTKYRTRQIDLTKFWIETFLIEDLDKIKSKTSNMLDSALKNQSIEFERMTTQLIGYDVAKPKIKENNIAKQSRSKPLSKTPKSRSDSKTGSKTPKSKSDSKTGSKTPKSKTSKSKTPKSKTSKSKTPKSKSDSKTGSKTPKSKSDSKTGAKRKTKKIDM
jgi:23S rRNA U2552 (ribose-2'-O)-methylase RlmE/FtsJ